MRTIGSLLAAGHETVFIYNHNGEEVRHFDTYCSNRSEGHC